MASTSKPTEAINSSTSNAVRLPMKVIERIWEYLDIKDRVKVQRVSELWNHHSRKSAYIWKNMLYLRDCEADIRDQMRILSLVGKWTKMEFSHLAVSLQVFNEYQIHASKNFLLLLPGMNVQHLIISSKTSDIFKPMTEMRIKESLENFEKIPGLCCFSKEDERQHQIECMRSSLKEPRSPIPSESPKWQLLDGILRKAKNAQDLALLKGISNCSNLRSLILNIDYNLLSHFSQKMPIDQCELDILSVQNTTGENSTFLNVQQHRSEYDMVKKARVIDLIDFDAISCKKMLSNMLSAACQTLEYLTLNLCTPALEKICEQASCQCNKEPEIKFVRLPRLHILWLNIQNEPSPIVKFNCPNLKFLKVNSLQNLKIFLKIPSIEALFLTGTQDLNEDSAWSHLTQIAANTLRTLYIYSDCMSESRFFDLLFQKEKFPYLRKIVVLASQNPLFRLKLDIFYNLSPTKLYNFRKIDMLVWQCAKDDEYPGTATFDFMREHFTPNFRCIRQTFDDPVNDMEYSAELMGEFVRCKSETDKLNHFQQFLQREHRAWPSIKSDSGMNGDNEDDLIALFAEKACIRADSPCESLYLYEDYDQNSDGASSDL